MKKTVYLVFLALCMAVLSACSKSETEETTTQAAAETVAETEAEAAGTTDAAAINEIVAGLNMVAPSSFGTIEKLCDYKGITLEVEKVEEVNDEYVEEYLAEYVLGTEEVDGPIEEGDIANIDYEGKLNGVAFDGGTAQGTDLEIGSGTFISGFEDGLIGKKAGETVDLDLKFPVSYGNTELAGKAVVFTVTINSVSRSKKLTEDVAKELEFDSVADLKAFYERYLKAQIAVQTTYAAALEYLLENCEVTASPEAVEYMLNLEIKNMASYYEQYGLDIGTVITEYAGMSYEDFIDQYIGDAMEDTVKQRLILDEIAKRENITVSDQDVTDFALDYGIRSAEDLKSAFEDEETMRERVLEEKACKLVVDNATINYTE